MRIFLIGFMKSGKSTIAEEVSLKYKVESFFLDNIFEEEYGNINSYFKKYGEKDFRQKEKEILFNTCFPKNSIVSCGGGIVEDQDNMLYMKSLGKVVYLYCDLENLFMREDNVERPLWNDKKSITALYRKRELLYRKYSDLIINNTNITSTVERIAKYASYNLS